MFVHMSIHSVKEEYEEQLIASMHRFGAAMKDQAGHISAHTLKDESTGKLIGLAMWGSKEEWEAARPAMYAAVEGDDFDTWESAPTKVFHLLEK